MKCCSEPDSDCIGGSGIVELVYFDLLGLVGCSNRAQKILVVVCEAWKFDQWTVDSMVLIWLC